MINGLESVQFEPNCVKTGLLMLWMSHKKTWRKRSVKIFRRSDDGFERLDYRCVTKKNDCYKSLSLHGLISARLIQDKTYKTIILLTLSDERTLQLGLKDSCDLESELDDWLQCIKTVCWGHDRELLSQPLSVSTSENVYEQPEATEYCSGGSDNSSNLSKHGSIDLYQSVEDSQENEIYTPSSESDRSIGCIFKVTIKETESAKACKLNGVYALEVKHDGLILRNYETRSAIFEWKLEFIRRFGANNKQKVFRFEAGRRCIGYAGTFEFFSDQYTNIPKVIRECVNRHKCGLSNPSSNTPPSHTPAAQGNSLEKEDKTRVEKERLKEPAEKERPLSFLETGESLYSQVDDAKKQQQAISPNSIAMMSNRITTLEHVMKTNQPSTVPTLPNRTGDEDLYQEPLLSEDEYDPAIVKQAENFTIAPCGAVQHVGVRASLKGGRILGPEDYYEELHNATSGIPSLRSGDSTTPVNVSSTPSSEDECVGLYSNIDISADHGNGTIIRTKSTDRPTSNGEGEVGSIPDAEADQVTENIYDSTPVNDEEQPPEPPTRRTSFQPANFAVVTPADFPRAPFPCNIPRPPGLLQMLNVPRQHNIKSNLQPRHFGDSYS